MPVETEEMKRKNREDSGKAKTQQCAAAGAAGGAKLAGGGVSAKRVRAKERMMKTFFEKEGRWPSRSEATERDIEHLSKKHVI